MKIVTYTDNNVVEVHDMDNGVFVRWNGGKSHTFNIYTIEDQYNFDCFTSYNYKDKKTGNHVWTKAGAIKQMIKHLKEQAQ